MSKTKISVKEYDNNTKFGVIKLDGFFSNAVKKQMSSDNESLNEESLNQIFNNAANVLNNCPNPAFTGEFKRTGIIIGKVQSGKTSNFISVLALAFDNGYNLAVVFGGNTRELLSQNFSRIKSSFNVTTNRLKVLNTIDNERQINSETIASFIRSGCKVIIVCLKSPQKKYQKHMTMVTKLFDSSKLANETTIIIDDEGDQATLNAKVYSKEKEIDKKLSETYRAAIELKSKIKRHCFLSVTATPQANILIKSSDLLSPDFGQLIYPGVGYCGLEVFHGIKQDIYVKEIDEKEPNLIDTDSGIPDSFVLALAAFYVSNAIRISRGDDGVHSMLIHPSVRKFDHNSVKKKVDHLINSWKRIISCGVKDISYKPLKNDVLLKAYNMYVKDEVKCKPFDELEPTILECINKSSDSLIFNSDQINPGADADLYSTRIYLGGNILERGLTIKGLAVTYITRRAKGTSTVDTTEQRARWFGYKHVPFYDDYIDICRVWATLPIKEDFSSIYECDEEMWSCIERNIKNGNNFKELPRFFKLQTGLSHKLKLTRSNVARTQDYSWTEWKTQRLYVDNKELSEKNINILEEFKKQFKGKEINHGGVNKHLYQYDIPFKDFINGVYKKINLKKEESLNYEYLCFINDLINKYKLENKIDICWVRYKTNEIRKILENGTIQQFFRGRDLKTNELGIREYEGDRSTCDARPDRMQVQIHYIKASNLSNNDYYSPSFAFYIPTSYAIKIGSIKGRSND